MGCKQSMSSRLKVTAQVHTGHRPLSHQSPLTHSVALSCEVHAAATHTRDRTGGSGAHPWWVASPRRAQRPISAGVRRWEGALTSCTGLGTGVEEPCVGGWTRRAGAPTVGQTPAQASGLRRGVGAEVCVVDRYVGRTVDESVPGCRSHPKSFGV